MTEDGFDEQRYNRQLYVIGKDGMQKLNDASVLIAGMSGLGAEIAKDIILTGLKNVTIQDDKCADVKDLGTNFCLTTQDIGKNRAVASLPMLAELNPLVNVRAVSEPLTTDLISKYQCVIITESLGQKALIEFSEFCHTNNIPILLCETRGVFGWLFVDFGEEFEVQDPRGDQPSKFQIHSIARGEKTEIEIEGERHGLGYGDQVRFHGIKGITQLNEGLFTVEDCLSPTCFSIDFDTRKSPPWEASAASGEEVILPQTFNFKRFKEAMKCRDLSPTGERKNSLQCLLAFLTAQRERDEPAPVDFVEFAKKVNEELKLVDNVDEAFMKEFDREKGATIGGTCAFFGGFAGHEVLKAVARKFTPLQQFLCLSYTSALPPGPIEFTPKGDRYDSYRQVFGNAQQERMSQLRYFLIGAGALGCELMKNFAMGGFCTSGKGEMIVTDMDSIEKSNLSRQFLFRDKDIGKMKSETAANATKLMNPEFRVVAHCSKLAEETLEFYNDDFYENLDGVCNALDNMEAREFSDELCMRYSRPLIDSGTLGARCHMRVMVPHITHRFGKVGSAKGGDVAMCTVHVIVRKIEDAIGWVKNEFHGLFFEEPTAVNAFLENPESFKGESSDSKVSLTRKAVRRFFEHGRCQSFDDCIAWARRQFNQFLKLDITELTKLYPRDHKDGNGLPFWSHTRPFPTTIEYDPSNELHATFIKTAAVLWAHVQGIECGDLSSAPEKAASVPVTESITVDDKESLADEEIAKWKELGKTLCPVNFEKDDDLHVDFVWALANLRAETFHVQPESKFEVKRIAGAIVPAMETTTAMVTGLVTLELYKTHCLEPKKREDFRSLDGHLSFADLNFTLARQPESMTCPFSGQKRTEWETWKVEGDLTIGQFVDVLKEKFNCNVCAIYYGTSVVWMSEEEKLKEKISEIVVRLRGKPFVSGQHNIVLSVVDPDDGFVETVLPRIPAVILKFR